MWPLSGLLSLAVADGTCTSASTVTTSTVEPVTVKLNQPTSCISLLVCALVYNIHGMFHQLNQSFSSPLTLMPKNQLQESEVHLVSILIFGHHSHDGWLSPWHDSTQYIFNWTAHVILTSQLLSSDDTMSILCCQLSELEMLTQTSDCWHSHSFLPVHCKVKWGNQSVAMCLNCKWSLLNVSPEQE